MQTTINNCRLSSFRLSGAAVFWTLTNSKQTNTDSARILDELIRKIPVFPFSGGVFDIDQQTNTDSARILDDLIKKIPLKEVSLSLSKWLPVQALPEEKLSHRVPRVQPLLARPQGLPRYTILILTIE